MLKQDIVHLTNAIYTNLQTLINVVPRCLFHVILG